MSGELREGCPISRAWFAREVGKLTFVPVQGHVTHRDVVEVGCARKTHGWKVPQCSAVCRRDGDLRNILGFVFGSLTSGAPFPARCVREKWGFSQLFPGFIPTGSRALKTERLEPRGRAALLAPRQHAPQEMGFSPCGRNLASCCHSE